MALSPLLVLSTIVFLQLRYDAVVTAQLNPRAPIHRTVMPAEVVRHFTFGFDNVLADYYWVTAVQTYLKWDSFDQFYPEYFRIISTLDPKFEYPYHFAILTLPTKMNPESLVWLQEISEGAVRAFPDKWRIPLTAATQFHIIGKDNARAIHFLETANSMPSATELVRRMYGIYLMRDATDYKKSRAMFEAILETADNDETKRIATERILLLDLVEMLEQGIATYKTAYGVFPATVDEFLKKEKLQLPETATALLQKFSPKVDQTTGKIILR